MVRVGRIELPSWPWQGHVLPLNYTRFFVCRTVYSIPLLIFLCHYCYAHPIFFFEEMVYFLYMYVTRRRAVILFSLFLFLTTLFYTHFIHVKRAFSSFGLIDSRHILVGMSDVRLTIFEVAEIFLVEYSDFGCLMCAVMQETFDRIVSEQKIFSRHLYPRQESSSFRLAVAAECVAKHAGEEAYASFVQYLYSSQHVSEALEDAAFLALK